MDRTNQTIWATGPKPPAHRTKVVNAGGMKADTFFMHVRARHPELASETSIPAMRECHDQTHELIPMILDHWHCKG